MPMKAFALPVLLLGSLFVTAARPMVTEENPAAAPVYDEKADAKADIAAALVRARRENRRVLIQWGANWCSWCKKLHALFGENADMSRKLLYEYDVVRVDV